MNNIFVGNISCQTPQAVAFVEVTEPQAAQTAISQLMAPNSTGGGMIQSVIEGEHCEQENLARRLARKGEPLSTSSENQNLIEANA